MNDRGDSFHLLLTAGFLLNNGGNGHYLIHGIAQLFGLGAIFLGDFAVAVRQEFLHHAGRVLPHKKLVGIREHKALQAVRHMLIGL